MKISKLFHWLYAFVMLLPVFFITGRCLYVTFNQNAKDSWSGDYGVTYKYQSNEVTNTDSLIIGNIYHFGGELFDDILPTDIGYQYEFQFKILNGYFQIEYSNVYIDDALQPIILNENYVIDIGTYYDDDLDIRAFNIYTYVSNNLDNYLSYCIEFAFIDSINVNCDILLTGKNFTDFVPDINTSLNAIFQYTDYNEILSVQSLATLDNAFIYSVNQLNEVPLFSWAKTSFLVAPFQYIGGVFGIPNDSPITTLMSYWLDLSIIWLVFDLIMYVPLLVHRWLDKGVLE